MIMNKKIQERQKQYEQLEKEGRLDAHVRDVDHLQAEPLSEEYQFIPRFFLTKWIYAVIWYIAVFLIAPIVTFVLYGVRIKGRRNLKHLKTGAISICNHCVDMDVVFVAQSLMPKKVYYTTLESNMRLPIIGHIIKAFGGLPICSRPSMQVEFNRTVAELVSKGKIVHFMPEGSLWAYYDKIRPFKKGAFYYAVQNQVPILPICINFRQPRKWQTFFGIRAQLVTVHIGKPIFADPDLHKKDQIEQLRVRSQHIMERMHENFKLVDKSHVQQEEQKEQDKI